MNVEERKAALRAAMDLVGLDEDCLDILARQAVHRSHAAGELISPDDERSRGLYVVVDGLVSVTSRGEHRRAPVAVELGAGGVFGEDSVSDTGMTGARAYRRCNILFLDGDMLLRTARTMAPIARVIERLTLVQHHGKWIVDRLRDSALFQFVPPFELFPLLEGIELIDAAPDEVIYSGTEEFEHVVMVFDGRVELEVPGKIRIGRKTYEPRPVNLGAGALIGEESLIEAGPLLHRVTAGSEGCRLLRFRTDVFRDQLGASPSFRRGLFASSVLEDGDRRTIIATHAAHDLELGRSNWVGLVGDSRELGVNTLTTWLAESAALEWGDRVVVLGLDADAPLDPVFLPTRDLGEGHVREVRINPAVRKYQPAILRMSLEADMVILDFGDLDPHEHPFWLERVRRTIYVAGNAYEPIDERLLDSLVRPLVYTAVVPSGPAPVGEPRNVPRGTLRVHRDLIAEARRGTALDKLAPRLRRQVSRWMRGVTERRVGVALGGGGALSMAELAVLQRLHERGIPVDLVAGVSGGSVIGAFYAASDDIQPLPEPPPPAALADLPGLARVIQVGPEFERVCGPPGTAISSSVVTRFIEDHVGDVRLEDMLLPFIPVAVDIDSATQVDIRTGPIGFGVRASGSFPGTFTPTTIDREELKSRRDLPWQRTRDLPSPHSDSRQHYRYVDGGVINNIPDDTLRLEGAQIVLACNVVPAPTPRSESSGKAFRQTQAALRQKSGRFYRFLREVEPVVRLDDTVRSIFMLLHQPADWEARSADAKFQARIRGYTLLDWGEGDAIRQQTLDEVRGPIVDKAIDDLERAYRSMKWRRDEDMGIDQLAAVIEGLVLASLPSDMTT